MVQRTDPGKKQISTVFDFVFVGSCFLVFTSLSCPRLEQNGLLKDFSFFLAYFLYHGFFGSVPCSLLSPGDIFGLHTFLSLCLSFSYFLPYMAVSPDVVTAHIWTFTRFRCDAEWITTTHMEALPVSWLCAISTDSDQKMYNLVVNEP